MTARITGWGSPSAGLSPVKPRASKDDRLEVPVPRRQAHVALTTAQVVDEAVEDVLSDSSMQPEVAQAMKKLLAVDMGSDAAHAYYTSAANAGLGKSAARAHRKQVNVNYVLDEEGMTLLSKYVPEYKLAFRSRDIHDHPLAAACRILDRSLILSRVPPGARVIDMGSSVIDYILDGSLGKVLHACCPVVDVKDPTRRALVDMRVRKLLTDDIADNVAASARAYLAREPAAVCQKLTQECGWSADVILSMHVYDVLMSSWPAIVEKHGAKVVEGCVLFPQGMFSRSCGVMETAGARYEIDTEADLFRMGFRDSPAWWYSHKWSEFMKYGVDQVLLGKKGVYSYKVVERRGDTIFFRILPMRLPTFSAFRQTFKLPGVQMVRVRGFELGAQDQPLRYRAKQYLWPYPLWQDLLTHATIMLERKTLDLERMFNFYRTVAPRQTINAVCVAGGYTVNIDELAPLIVHVSLAAAAQVYKTQKGVEAHVNSTMRDRVRKEEWTVYKALASVGVSLRALAGLVCYPLEILGRFIDTASSSVMSRELVDWEPEVQVQSMSVKLLLAGNLNYANILSDFVVDDDWSDMFVRAAPMDHISAAMSDPDLAKMLLESCFDDIPSDVLRDLEDTVGVGKVKVDLDSKGKAVSVTATAVPTVASVGTSALQSATTAVGESQRVMAINEAIAQCEAEQVAVQASCMTVWRELMVTGVPNSVALVTRREEYRNPMFWRVESGVITSSLMSPNVDAFDHSAVYIPVPDAATRCHLTPVHEEKFQGMSGGKFVDRTYYKLGDSSYTGWCLTTQDLVVYNGPEIVQSLRLALQLDLSCEMISVVGPPGSGKTYEIKNRLKPTNFVMAPVKRICRATAADISEMSPELAVMAIDRVRTLDSYLVNYGISKRVQSFSTDVLYADEVFMAASGRWYAAAALLGAKITYCYGDPRQIPPVVRQGVSSQFLAMVGDRTEYRWLSYRCPADAVAAWGHLYDHKVRSSSGGTNSMSRVKNHHGLSDHPGQVMLGFYQADKKEIRRIYPNLSVNVSTVHEVQGDTFDHVRLHRFDNRRRSDKMALFDKEGYVLVAMSRHKKSFVYVSSAPSDLVLEWMGRAKDQRRVQAAAEVATAGESKEFI